MKLIAGIILSALVLQALAKPSSFEENFRTGFQAGIEENEFKFLLNTLEGGKLKPVEFVPSEKSEGFKPYNEDVENFRRELDVQFYRYQRFYERISTQLSVHRLEHVDLVTMIYNRLITVFGEDIEAIRQAGHELRTLLEHERNELGEDNACLQAITDRHHENSRNVGSTIQQCAIFANTTLSTMIRNVFYPTFVQIQGQISYVPIQTVNVLSRGNILQDEEAILEFLRDQFEVYDIQWTTAVAQLTSWEMNRLEVDGLFLVDEMAQCMSGAVIEYIGTNSRLETEVRTCRTA